MAFAFLDFFFFFNDTATTEIYTSSHTLSLHDALPIPGETSILIGGALAARGELDLPLVWLFAATGAIVGDNIGYLIGRFFLRRLLTGTGRLAHRLERSVERSEVFFRRHGG